MTKRLPWLMAVSLLLGVVFGWMSRPVEELVSPVVQVHSGEDEIERLQAEVDALRGEVDGLRRELAKARAGKAALEVEAHGVPEAVVQATQDDQTGR